MREKERESERSASTATQPVNGRVRASACVRSCTVPARSESTHLLVVALLLRLVHLDRRALGLRLRLRLATSTNLHEQRTVHMRSPVHHLYKV